MSCRPVRLLTVVGFGWAAAQPRVGSRARAGGSPTMFSAPLLAGALLEYQPSVWFEWLAGRHGVPPAGTRWGGMARRTGVGAADATFAAADGRPNGDAVGVVVTRRRRDVVAGVAETPLARLTATGRARRRERLGDR